MICLLKHLSETLEKQVANFSYCFLRLFPDLSVAEYLHLLFEHIFLNSGHKKRVRHLPENCAAFLQFTEARCFEEIN